MKHNHISHDTKATAGSTAVLDQLQGEIADLRELNARLQRRLAETEMDAELQARADRILAISPPTVA